MGSHKPVLLREEPNYLHMTYPVLGFQCVSVPFSPHQNAAVENQVRPTLDSLVDDSDRDVRYFSRKAMQAVAAMG